MVSQPPHIIIINTFNTFNTLAPFQFPAQGAVQLSVDYMCNTSECMDTRPVRSQLKLILSTQGSALRQDHKYTFLTATSILEQKSALHMRVRAVRCENASTCQEKAAITILLST